jgi:hypothetical protein
VATRSPPTCWPAAIRHVLTLRWRRGPRQPFGRPHAADGRGRTHLATIRQGDGNRSCFDTFHYDRTLSGTPGRSV